MSLATFEIVVVVSRGDFHDTCAEIHFHHGVSNHEHLAIWMEGVLDLLTNVGLVTVIFRVHTYSCIPKHRFQSSRCHD